jgi:DNA ligase 1
MDNFKQPLLAEDFVESELVMGGVLSPKLDGIRSLGVRGGLMSRSMKSIPNPHAVDLFRQYQGLDGELIFGEPTSPTCYSDTYSAVMKKSATSADNIRLFVFDSLFKLDEPWEDRIKRAQDLVAKASDPRLVLVEHHPIPDVATMLAKEEEWLELGYEGAMYRKKEAHYKQGRSTVKEGILLKVKRFADGEARILSVHEMMENTNKAFTNELGHTERSTHKEGMVGKGTFGYAMVEDLVTKEVFSIGGGKGVTKKVRDELWATRESLPGKLVKYKHFPIGRKDRPRFPGFRADEKEWIGFRSPLDMGMAA